MEMGHKIGHSLMAAFMGVSNAEQAAREPMNLAIEPAVRRRHQSAKPSYPACQRAASAAAVVCGYTCQKIPGMFAEYIPIVLLSADSAFAIRDDLSSF
jgi:hypothetical protein